MSDITRWKVSGPTTRLQPDANGPWVALVDYYRVIDRLIAERDEARAEVEQLKEQVGALTVAVEQADEMKAHAEAAAAAEEAETDRVMSERDAAQAEVERLTRARDGLRDSLREALEERNDARYEAGQLRRDLSNQLAKARAQVEWLKYPVATLTGAVEQANKAKADAEAAAAREEAETDRVVADGNRALAEVERLTIELNDTREKLARVQVQYDEFAKVTAKVIDQHQRERDHARQQVYLLRQAGADRPTDEDIWREAFMSAVQDVHKNWMDVADVALAQYRKRWPR